MDTVRFSGEIRYWSPERGGGLAVLDVPLEHVKTLGGLKQQRVSGTLGGAGFASSVMPAGGGRLALSVSKAIMRAAGADVGDMVDVEITSVGPAA